MSWSTIMTGLGAVVTLPLGFNTFVELGRDLDTIFIPSGIVCVILFVGLVDDAGTRDNQLLEFDRE